MPRTPAKRKKKIESEREIETALEDIYQDGAGNVPDMTRIERHGSRTWMVVLTFLLLFMGAAAASAWLGFFMFSPSQKFSESNIVAAISVPPSIVSGIEQPYSITVSNTGALALANSQVNVKLPDQFFVVSSTPVATTERGDRWKLGALDGDESKTISFTAVYSMPQGTRSQIRTYVDYRPSNFNSDFEKVVDTSLEVAANAIDLTAEKKSNADGADEIIVKYKNISGLKLVDAKIRAAVGNGFKLKKSTPAAQMQSGSVVLALPALEPSQEGVLTFSGSYGAGVSAPNPLEIFFERAVAGRTIVLAVAQLTNDGPVQPVSAVKPLTITANNAAETSIKTGDAVQLRATYKNTTEKVIKNITLVVTGDTPSVKGKSAFDFTKLATVGDPDVVGKQLSPEVREAKVTWHPEKTPVLQSLGPGQEVTIEAKITLKPSDEPFKKPEATFVASLSADDEVLQLSDPAIIKIIN